MKKLLATILCIAMLLTLGSMPLADLTAIPYYVWSNRGINAMRVWMKE